MLDSLCTLGGSIQWGASVETGIQYGWSLHTHTHLPWEATWQELVWGERGVEMMWKVYMQCVSVCVCVCDIIQSPLLSIFSPNFKSSSQEDICTPICIVAPFTILSKFYRFSQYPHLTKAVFISENFEARTHLEACRSIFCSCNPYTNLFPKAVFIKPVAVWQMLLEQRHTIEYVNLNPNRKDLKAITKANTWRRKLREMPYDSKLVMSSWERLKTPASLG